MIFASGLEAISPLIVTFAQFVYERQQAPFVSASVQRAADLMKQREPITGDYAETLFRVRIEATERYETTRFYILLHTLIVAVASELIAARGGVLLHLILSETDTLTSIIFNKLAAILQRGNCEVGD